MPLFNHIFIYTEQLGKVLQNRHNDLTFNDKVAVGAVAGSVTFKPEFSQWQAHIKAQVAKSKTGTPIEHI